MNRFVIFLCLWVFSIVGVSAQKKTYYYRLEKIVTNGVTDTNVDGGQFITFLGGDKCYESDYIGMSVGHGDLRKASSASTKFSGPSYWGSNTTFTFSADYTTFNVVSSSGSTYYYRRGTAPDGEYTCSLIRPKGSSGGGGGTPVVTQPINGGGYNGGTVTPVTPDRSGQSTYQGTPTKHWKNVTRTYDCDRCHRSGKCTWCNGKGYTYGIGNSIIDCSNCDGYKTGRCSKCHGAGTITKLEQVYE